MRKYMSTFFYFYFLSYWMTLQVCMIFIMYTGTIMNARTAFHEYGMKQTRG